MRRISFIAFAIFPVTLLAQTTIPSDQPLKPAIINNVGNHHHQVSTTNAEAQKFFDQGMALLFGFNHDESMRSFSRAAELDPKLAMAHWGVAMALGPNYNVDVDPPREKAACQEIQKAIQLSAGASAPERDYINALAVRYSDKPDADLKKLAEAYVKSMEQLSGKYPDDLDAATFYAESMMLLHPWRLWTREGKPAYEDTPKIVAVLESVLKRDPNHMGANHFYIHAVEGSDHPQVALESAAVLPGLAPASGHLVHMPAHIYARTGDHEAAASSNVAAVAADQDYLKNRNDGGIYPMVYYSHNWHFLSYARLLEGNYAGSKNAADELVKNVAPHIEMMPMLEGFAIAPTLVMMRFNKWDDILKLPDPGEKMPTCRLTWHFARSMALAGTGKPDDAEKEKQAMNDVAKGLPPDAMVGMLNTAAIVVEASNELLAGRIALARKDNKAAIAAFQRAVAVEMRMIYDEPPAWWFAAREDLGNALLMDGQAAEAEMVFRKELEIAPRDGRSLHGLSKSLSAQGKTYEASLVETQFKTAWKNADTELK